MCDFQQLYFSDDGYIVRCPECNHYQIGYASIMLTLTEREFARLCRNVKKINTEPGYAGSPAAKSVIIPTSCKCINMLLSRSEAIRLSEILEEADTELKTLALISMFNS